VTDPVLCDRCGQPADADRIEVTTWGDLEPRYVWGWIVCTTPGCVEEYGRVGRLLEEVR